MKRFLKTFIAVSTFLACTPAKAERVRVVHCYDGDTVRVTSGEVIRIACIDTPELTGEYAQPYRAQRAKNHLIRLVDSKWVTLKRLTRDRYGRTVAELFLGDVNVGRQMVVSGHAKIFRRYAYHCEWVKYSVQ